MELLQVIGIFNRIAGDKLLRDGMGFSEPIVSMENGNLVDNFFVYYVNIEGNLVSGPVARIGIRADSAEIEYLVFCDDQPFSLGPYETMTISKHNITEQDFKVYEKCYKNVRKIAYKANCTVSEKKDIIDYLQVLKKNIVPEMLKLYEEMVPSFFVWVRKEIDCI